MPSELFLVNTLKCILPGLDSVIFNFENNYTVSNE